MLDLLCTSARSACTEGSASREAWSCLSHSGSARRREMVPRWGLRLRASAAVLLDPTVCSKEKSNSPRRACQRVCRPERSFFGEKVAGGNVVREYGEGSVEEVVAPSAQAVDHDDEFFFVGGVVKFGGAPFLTFV